jgi:hypothetical protein
MAVMVAPEQMVCDAGALTTSGIGFTSTVAVADVPVHPFAVGIRVNVTVTGAAVVLVNVPVILPDPLAAIPVTVAVLFLVQAYVVPPTFPLKAMEVMVAPEQMVCDAGILTTLGIGFTSTVAVTAEPVHPFAVGVMVNVTVTGAADVFVNAPLILPDPLAAIPVTEAVLSLAQV